MLPAANQPHEVLQTSKATPLWNPGVILKKADSVTPREAPPGVDHGEAPLMVDIMSGPNAPLAKAFVMAQWRTSNELPAIFAVVPRSRSTGIRWPPNG